MRPAESRWYFYDNRTEDYDNEYADYDDEYYGDYDCYEEKHGDERGDYIKRDGEDYAAKHEEEK